MSPTDDYERTLAIRFPDASGTVLQGTQVITPVEWAYGRESIDSQPDPASMSCTISWLNLDPTYTPNRGARVEAVYDPGLPSERVVFAGRLANVSAAKVIPYGPSDFYWTQFEISAAGWLTEWGGDSNSTYLDSGTETQQLTELRGFAPPSFPPLTWTGLSPFIRFGNVSEASYLDRLHAIATDTGAMVVDTVDGVRYFGRLTRENVAPPTFTIRDDLLILPGEWDVGPHINTVYQPWGRKPAPDTERVAGAADPGAFWNFQDGFFVPTAGNINFSLANRYLAIHAVDNNNPGVDRSDWLAEHSEVGTFIAIWDVTSNPVREPVFQIDSVSVSGQVWTYTIRASEPDDYPRHGLLCFPHFPDDVEAKGKVYAGDVNDYLLRGPFRYEPEASMLTRSADAATRANRVVELWSTELWTPRVEVRLDLAQDQAEWDALVALKPNDAVLIESLDPDTPGFTAPGTSSPWFIEGVEHSVDRVGEGRFSHTMTLSVSPYDRFQ